MTHFRKLCWYLLWALPLGLISCQSNSSESVASQADSVAKIEPEGFTLTPHDTLPYPVVTDFDELAPLFAQNTDTTYVINFWATWCAPCVAELPYFEQLAETYSDEAVRFVMVSLDFKKEIDRKLLKFVRERPFEMPVVALIDPKSNVWIDQVEASWTGAIPITIFYRKDQRLFHDSSFEDYAELESAFLEIHPTESKK